MQGQSYWEIKRYRVRVHQKFDDRSFLTINPSIHPSETSDVHPRLLVTTLRLVYLSQLMDVKDFFQDASSKKVK